MKKVFMLLVLTTTGAILLSACGTQIQDYTAEQKQKVSHAEIRNITPDNKKAEEWKKIAAKIEAEKKAEEERKRLEEEKKRQERQRQRDQQQNPNDNGKQTSDGTRKNTGISNTTKVPISFVNGVYQLPGKFFNQIKHVNGVGTIQNPDNILVMANKSFYLPSTYKPKDLIRANVPCVFKSGEQNYLRKEAAQALGRMFSGAKKQGVHLIARSGFRSYQTQDYLFKKEVEAVGYDKAVRAVAKPGTSEHQTGLTMDITANSVNQQLVESFGTTKEGNWLENNAHKYGFILRYPKGKENITKYMYEPWHFRYVGVEAAKVIYENGWTLEEFFNMVEGV